MRLWTAPGEKDVPLPFLGVSLACFVEEIDGVTGEVVITKGDVAEVGERLGACEVDGR